MPKKDGTGPEGKGPRTGRGSGRCREKNKNEETPGVARGDGKNRRFGQGQKMGKSGK